MSIKSNKLHETNQWKINDWMLFTIKLVTIRPLLGLLLAYKYWKITKIMRSAQRKPVQEATSKLNITESVALFIY